MIGHQFGKKSPKLSFFDPIFKRHRSVDLAASENAVLCQLSVSHASNTLLWLVDAVESGYLVVRFLALWLVDAVESGYNLYTKHVYTECTAEGWADQQVSDGGPRSLYIQYKCTELKNDESDYDDKSGTDL